MDKVELLDKSFKNKTTVFISAEDGLVSEVKSEKVVADNISMPSWIICLATTTKKTEAEKVAEKFRQLGYQTGVLWIPDYSSLSGARMWLAYVGPVSYADRSSANTLLQKVKQQMSSAYGLKIDQSGIREQL